MTGEKLKKAINILAAYELKEFGDLGYEKEAIINAVRFNFGVNWGVAYTEDEQVSALDANKVEHEVIFDTVEVLVNLSLNQFVNICDWGKKRIVATEVYSDDDMLRCLENMSFSTLVSDAADDCLRALMMQGDPTVHTIGNTIYSTIYKEENENG